MNNSEDTLHQVSNSNDENEMLRAATAVNWFNSTQKGSFSPFDLEPLSDFIYEIYPTFFMSGIRIRGAGYFISEEGSVRDAKNASAHVPCSYSYGLLSLLVRNLIKDNQWEIHPEEIARIIRRCEMDFSKEYLDMFPYVVRVYTSNQGKQAEYSTMFRNSVQFKPYVYEEPQASVRQVVDYKMDKIKEETNKEEGVFNIVDDAGLGFVALAGFPGPYIKAFMQTMTPDKITYMCDSMKDNRVVLSLCMGVSYWERGEYHTINECLVFAGLWEQSVPNRPGFGYDFHVKHLGDRLCDIPQIYNMRTLIFDWIKHRYRRRHRRVSYLDVLFESQVRLKDVPFKKGLENKKD